MTLITEIGVETLLKFVYSTAMIINTVDDLIAVTEMTGAEAAEIHQRLILSTIDLDSGVSVGRFSEEFGLMPMLVARNLSDIRPEDHSLMSLISTNELLIKTFGKSRMSREVVEGGYVKMEKFWRTNDPLGVYRPGDMFYVDENHPWMPYFPLLILGPTAFVGMMILFAWIGHILVK
jgi:hypothetical protein